MPISTSTTWSTQRLTEVLGPLALPANVAKLVVAKVANFDSISGQPSLTKQYAVDTDLGAAAAGSEGAAPATTTLAKAAAITIAVAENALAAAEITARAARKKFPGLSGDIVNAAFQSGDAARVAAVLGPEASRLARMCLEKLEDDCANLLSGFANTVGTSGVDLTLNNMITSIYTLKTLEPPHENWTFVLTPNQVLELQLELGVTSGGFGGSVWSSTADASFFNHRPDMAMTGVRNTFLGIPVLEYSHSLRTLANGTADVAGALMCVGVGAPDVPGAQVGAIGIVEDEPLSFSVTFDALNRATDFVAVMEYGTGEIRDVNAVSIITDAP